MTREEATKVLEKQFDESCGDYRYQNKDKLDYSAVSLKNAKTLVKRHKDKLNRSREDTWKD